MNIKQCELRTKLAGTNDTARTATVIASTATVDSYRERFAEGAWNLSRYQKNPVVLLMHGGLPIGRAEDVTASGAELRATVRFAAAEVNPDAEKAYRMVKDGLLRGVSVGFLPRKVRAGEDGITTILEAELIELSLVSTPANPDALVVSVKSSGTPHGPLDAMRATQAEAMRKAEAAATRANLTGQAAADFEAWLSGEPGTATLSAREIAMCERMKIDPAKYAAQKAAINERTVKR